MVLSSPAIRAESHFNSFTTSFPTSSNFPSPLFFLLLLITFNSSLPSLPPSSLLSFPHPLCSCHLPSPSSPLPFLPSPLPPLSPFSPLPFLPSPLPPLSPSSPHPYHQDTQPLCILMEFACYGSLKDYLQRCGELVRQRSSAKVFTASSDTLTPPTIPLSTHVCSYHQQVLGHLNHYLAQGAGGRGSWQDYLPMASVREENQYQVGGALQRKDTSPCQPHPQEGGVVTCQHVEQGPPLCQEAWQVSATNRLATPDPGQEEGSNRSSYVYPQEQLSSERGTSPSGCPAGGQQQQQLSQQGTSLGGLGVQQMLEKRASPGCQTEGQRGASPGYQAGGQQGVSPECQAGGQRGISPECQAGGQRGISPGYQAGGQQGISPGYQAGGQQGISPGHQAGGQRGISPGYQAGGQRGISPGYQAGGQQLTVPQDPRIVQRSETPLSCPPSMDCMYCSQADHYRNLEKGEGSSLEAKVGEVAEAVELMTSDILNFALQIVRGMEHLENMKVWEGGRGRVYV